MRSTMKMMFLGMIALLVTGLSACETKVDTRTTEGKLKVATSVIPHAWLIRQIGGDHVDVAVAVPKGSGPHNYQPSDTEMARLASSAIYFRNGVPMENGGWFHAMEDKSWLKIVDLRQGIELMEMPAHAHHDEHGEDKHDDHGHDDHGHKEDKHGDHGHDEHKHDDHGHDDHGHDDHGHKEDKHDDHDHHEGGDDPHTWTSVVCLIHQADVVKDALIKADPDNKASYEANYAKVLKELESLHLSIKEQLASAKGKGFLIYHPAWGYFARDYGLTQHTIEIKGHAPSDQEMTEIIQLAKEKGIKVVFIQNTINHKSAERIADAIDAKVVEIDPLAEDVPGNLALVSKEIADAVK